MDLGLTTILEIFMVTVLICIPFVVLFNPKVKEKIREKNKSNYETKNDIDVANLKHRAIPKYRRKVGCVFQDYRLLKDRNVYENVAFAQRIVGTPTREIKKNVPAMLSLVGLAEK